LSEQSIFDESIFDVDSGTLEDTELVDGLVFNQKTAGAGGPKKVDKAKIGLIQFCISPPKTDVCLLGHVLCCLSSAVRFHALL